MDLFGYKQHEQTVNEFREELKERQQNETYLQERIAELELTLENQDFRRLDSFQDDQLSRQALDDINHLARVFYLKNPLIRRAVLTQANYVFGQGVEFEGEHEDVDEIIQDFIDDPKNKKELTTQQELIQKEIELTLFGNIFFAFFVDPATGRVRVRTMPMKQITEIITDEDDQKTVLFYKRSWMRGNEQVIKYYPDWGNKNPKKPVQGIDGSKIQSDVKIYHLSVNKLSDMTYGVSEVYSVINWARAYKDFLEDWATIVRAQSKFAWKVTTNKGNKGVSKLKEGLQSSFAKGGEQENNPAHAPGSTWIQSGGVNMEAMKHTGPPTKAEDGDKMVHMVSAGSGIFYHYLMGDPSTGNLATAKAMERPMELQFKNRQTLWKDAFQNIYNFVIEQSVRAPKGKLQGSIEKDHYGDDLIILEMNPETGDPIPKTVNITFPDLLEKDIETRVNAIVKAATMQGMPLAGTLEQEQITRMLLNALNVENVDEIIARMFPEDGQESRRDRNEKQFSKAMEELKEVIKEQNGKEN